MPKVCFYFQLHQPYRLRRYTIFDVGNSENYFAQEQKDDNKKIFKKVSKKSYVPMLSLLLKLVKRHKDFRFALSCSGIFLDQATEFDPKVIRLLQKLSETDQVEFLAETYYHSLASLYSEKEFFDQVKMHEDLLYKLFKKRPTVFRNTELIYSDHIGYLVSEMGYHAMLTEAVDRYLHGKPRTQLFRTNTDNPIPLLLKHAQLSDDIAFRFSNKNWESHPLSSETYVKWLNDYHESELINLFMDFETFGEHQWEDTGIFPFFEHMVEKFLRFSWNSFVTPSQIIKKVTVEKLPAYHVPEPISWADVDRDLTAWRGNELQHDTLRLIYDLEKEIKAKKDDQLLDDWRKLQTSDHFYYMCIKWSADGDVHSYFSPYDSPLDAYTRYSTVLADLKGRLFNKSKIEKLKYQTKFNDGNTKF